MTTDLRSASGAAAAVLETAKSVAAQGSTTTERI